MCNRNQYLTYTRTQISTKSFQFSFNSLHRANLKFNTEEKKTWYSAFLCHNHWCLCIFEGVHCATHGNASAWIFYFSLHCIALHYFWKTDFTSQCNRDALQLFIRLNACVLCLCPPVSNKMQLLPCSVCFEHNFLIPFLGEFQCASVCLCVCLWLLFPMKLQLYLFKTHYQFEFGTSSSIFGHRRTIACHHTRNNDKIRLKKMREEWETKWEWIWAHWKDYPAPPHHLVLSTWK